MRKTTRLLLAFLLAALLPLAATAAEEPLTEGSAEVGYWDADLEDSPDVAAEYETLDGGPDLRLHLQSIREGGAIEIDSSFRDAADQEHAIDFDVRRVWRSRTTLDAVLHRLGHDPLHNLEAATAHGRVTRFTDLDPTKVYEIDYQVFETWNEIQPRGFGNLTLGVGYRDQQREGHRQANVISHCDGCHVISQSRPVDETTTDVTLDAKLAFDRGHLRASMVSRELEEGTPFITQLFDDALHPELRTPVFDNRLQWDSAEGPQPIDAVPDISKDILRLDGLYAGANGLTLTAEGVWSQTDNDFTGNQSDYNGYLLSLARRFGADQRWSFRWRGRSYQLDNDDVFVDSIERLGLAGPQAGVTYRAIYGFDPDFLRRSALNRDVIESDVDLAYRFGRKTGTARFFWRYDDVDRDHFEVAPGETGTTTNEIGVSWSARPAKGWKTYVALTHGEVDNPFLAVDGKYSTLVSEAAANPFLPQAAQYYLFQDARIEEGAASPASWDELELRGSYSKGPTTLSGNFRYWDGDNDEGDLNDWARTLQAVTLTLFSAPAPRWQWHLAWAWNETDLEVPMTIPLFDG